MDYSRQNRRFRLIRQYKNFDSLNWEIESGYRCGVGRWKEEKGKNLNIDIIGYD